MYNHVSDLNNEFEHILRCEFSEEGSCNHTQDMAIECSEWMLIAVPTHTPPHIHSAGTSKYASPYDAEVRLVGGDYRSHGAVEVYLNDGWGTVCTENMTLSNAHSVCRQMGYTGATSFSQSSPPEYVAIVFPCVWLLNSGWLFDAHSSLQR